MKKIIVPADLKSVLDREDSFLRRADLRTYVAASNEEALTIHAHDKADLIVISLDEPGMDGETFCAEVRSRDDLREVSIIVVSPGGSPDDRIGRCRANAVVNGPVSPRELLDRAHHLLHIARREAYRAPISVKVRGEAGSAPFLCHAENISSSGMLFEADRLLPTGEGIRCSFIMPDMTHIKTEAEIVRVVQAWSDHETVQYGIRFCSLAESYRRAIEAYIEKQNRRK